MYVRFPERIAHGKVVFVLLSSAVARVVTLGKDPPRMSGWRMPPSAPEGIVRVSGCVLYVTCVTSPTLPLGAKNDDVASHPYVFSNCDWPMAFAKFQMLSFIQMTGCALAITSV